MHGLLLLALSFAGTDPAPVAASDPSLSLASLLAERPAPSWLEPQVRSAELDEDVTSTIPIGKQPNHLNIVLGTRQLEGSGWGPVDNPLTGGLSYDANTGGWFNWDVAFYFASDSGSTFSGGNSIGTDLDTYEVSFGLLKIIETRSIRPYIGAGGAWTYVDGKVTNGSVAASGNDSVFGGYVRAGLLWPVHNGYVGIDFRAAKFGDVELGGKDLAYGYGQVGVIFGYGF